MSGNTKECGRISPNTVGFWADMDNPYVTYDDNFIESEWWALKADLGQGPLIQGLQDRSLLSSLRNPAFMPRRWHRAIRIVKERSAIVRFKVVGEDAYIPGMDHNTVDTSI